MQRNHFENLILIVDDEPANLGILVDILKDTGINVSVALNGEKGIEQAETVRPDLILLDIMMPGIDGFETCRRLKQNDATRDIPVIFLTALSDTDQVVKGFEAGAVDYITKPFRQMEILVRINTQLALRKQIKNIIAKKTMEMSMLMAGGIAHEFNNKLFVVIGRCELLRDDYPHDKNITEHADEISGATGKMVNLVHRLLAYTSQMPGRPEPVLFNLFIKDTIAIIRHNMEQRISIETDLSPHIRKVNMDQKYMQLAMSEILTNAVEAISGTGTIIIRTKLADKKLSEPFFNAKTGTEEYVWLEIEDNGAGMDNKTKEKMWDPFFTTKFQGRGMGMSVISGIIRTHGGKIRVESEPGKGTCIHILLLHSESVQI